MVHIKRFSLRYIHNVLNNQQDFDEKSPCANQIKEKLSTATVTRSYCLSKLCFQQTKIQSSRPEVLRKNKLLQNFV